MLPHSTAAQSSGDHSAPHPALAQAEALITDQVTVLSTNLDDATGEWLDADLIARLLDAGALDATIRPVTMKRGRPGWQVEALCRPERSQQVAEALLVHTPTLGIRMHTADRLDPPTLTLQRGHSIRYNQRQNRHAA